MSTQVGYRIRGIEPVDLMLYPDPVKLMWWGWVVELGLKAKDRDLARGLDKDGVPLRPLKPESIRHRKSQVGPTDRYAPPLQPSHARSRVRSLLTGRAHLSSAEFWWRFDPVTGRSFAEVLAHQKEQGRDVFGLSSTATAWVQREASKRWDAWKRKSHVQTQRAAMPGRRVVTMPKAAKAPVVGVTLRGRTDLANMDAGAGADLARAGRALRTGRHTGFRRLNAEGEKWTPGPGVPAGPGSEPPLRPTATQRKAVEGALGVRFRPDPRAAARREVTVLVDVSKLDDALAADPASYVGSGGLGADFERYRRFERFLFNARATDGAISMPRATLDGDRPAISDGRHRFAVFRDQGAAVIPVTVHRSDAEEFRALFGASVSLLRSLIGLLAG